MTILAPGIENYQAACVRAGGLNLFGQPNFRLVVLRSRFQHCGGIEVNFHKPNGEFHHSEEVEAFMPRYLEHDSEPDSFCLEVWRAPSWYEAQGFGEDRAYEYNETGTKQIRRLESIPIRGGYEAVVWDSDYPWCFPPWGHYITINGQPRWKDRVSSQTIEKAIHLWLDNEHMKAEQRAALRNSLEEQKKERARDLQVERIAAKLTPFDLTAGTAMRGLKPVWK